MNCVRKLLKQHETVWFRIDGAEQTEFYKDLTDLGAVFLNGAPVTRDAIGCRMGVHRNGTVGYVSNLVWYMTFSSPTAPVKVDYGKLRAGEPFLITEPDIRPLGTV